MSCSSSSMLSSYKEKVKGLIELFHKWQLITGAQPKTATGYKVQTISFFQRYVVRDISLT